MAIMYVDIPYKEIKKYVDSVKKKKNICKVLPRGRFNLEAGADFEYSSLICSSADLPRECTGVGAEVCKNCKIKNRERLIMK